MERLGLEKLKERFWAECMEKGEHMQVLRKIIEIDDESATAAASAS
jgi:hypothetical protein